MNRRAVGWLLLLGSPGLWAGLAVTTIEATGADGWGATVIGFGGLGLAAISSAAGGALLAWRSGCGTTAIAALGGFAVGGIGYWVTIVAAFGILRHP